MKVLLRNTKTGQYYQEPTKWTPEPGAAADLQGLSRAVALAFERQMEDVEILLCYEDPRYDLVLPVLRRPQ